MTTRLYYRDAYLASFSANVVSRSDDGRRVYLDRTAFYPTSGGQPHDLGTIAGIPVEDVIDEDDRVAHVLAAPVTDDAVACRIDWSRRFDHMQQHTGQHIVSAVFADGLGMQTVSVHFGPGSSTLDLDAEHVDVECLEEVERRANGIIVENRPVTITFEEATSVAGLRKAVARGGTLRVVNIVGVDRSACGGTHVRASGEIGVVLLRRQEKVRKTTRIEFVCGFRAVRRARCDFDSLSRIAHGLTSGIDEAPALVETLAAHSRDAQSRVRRLETELAAFRARALYDGTPPDASGRRVTVDRGGAGSPDERRVFALAFCALPKAVFIALMEDPPAILLATSSDSGMDAGRTLKAVLEPLGGKGGGSPRMAQGSIPSAGALDEVARALQDRSPA